MSATLSLEPGERPGPGLRRIAGEEVAAASALLDAPTDDPAEDLHQVRLAAKRLRALWRLLRPEVERGLWDEGEALLTRAGRSMSGARDAVAAREAAALLLAGDELSGVERAALESAFTAINPAADTDALVGQGVALLRAFAATHARATVPGDAATALRPGLKAMLRRARRAWRGVEERGDDEDWHRLRRRSKALYFALRLLRQVAPGSVGRARALKALHRDLGVDHDLVVLAGVLGVASPALPAVRRAQAPLRLRARGASVAIFAERPRDAVALLLPSGDHA